MRRLADADPDAQLEWLDSAFAEARATCDWVFAIGHHPIYSAGDHGDHLDLLSKFQPLFQKHQARVPPHHRAARAERSLTRVVSCRARAPPQVASYIAGHDHDLQHIKWNNFNYIVSGAGSE